MQLLQFSAFRRSYKKLPQTARDLVDEVIAGLAADPAQGEMKVGDLTGVRVHKFRLASQLTLLAYRFDDEAQTLTLLALGPHENFYRDLKH